MIRRVLPPSGAAADYRRLWRIVDGAVADALYHHPEYLRPVKRGARPVERTARRSITKRVVGAVLADLAGTARGGVFGNAADSGRRTDTKDDAVGLG